MVNGVALGVMGIHLVVSLSSIQWHYDKSSSAVVRNCTLLENKSIFSMLVWYIFNLLKGKEIIRYSYVCALYYKILWWLFLWHIVLLNTIIFELLACGWCWCELDHPVPMLIEDWFCHSLLLVELFIDAFSFFPWMLFGLAALIWALGLGFSATQTVCAHITMKRTVIDIQ